MMKFKLFRVLIQLGSGVVIILWLLQLSSIEKVLTLILMINPLNIVLASIFFIIASTFVALSLYVSIKPIEASAPIGKIILGSFAGQLLSDVTPVRSGYFVTPLILKEQCNVPIKKGIVGVLTTGIVNSFVKVILSVIALLYFISFLPLNPMIINALIAGILFLLGVGVVLLVTLIEKRILRFAMIFEKIPIIKVITRKLIEMLNQIQGGVNIKKQFLKIFLLMLLSIITNAIALQFISDGLGFRSPSLIEFVFIATLVGSLMYIPVTIAGLGVQETGYVLLLTLLGMPFEKAVAFALLTRVLFTGTDIIGLPALIKIGFKKYEVKNNALK
ncbi:MAG: lysylphosphatidylglycerol synthase transmembrane domain-containing protein [Thermoprotei archaeon]|jgi:uncharacterized protein (TIRG00374 family)